MTRPTDSESLIGTVLDKRFVLKELIAEGGMAVVYRAEQIGLLRPVAVKLMHLNLELNSEFRARFLREGKILSGISHPSVVQFLHFGVSESGQPYLVMEFCEGVSLRKLVADSNVPVGCDRVISIGHAVAGALAEIHKHSVVHRDLTPGNVILTDLQAGSVKIIDFGLAFVDSEARMRLTSTGALVGSFYYMSPEQCAGRSATASSDVYSLGCILFELMEGRPPFDADTAVGVIFKHKEELLPEIRRKDAPPYLCALIRQCLAKEPEKRPAASELALYLNELSGGKPSEVVAFLSDPCRAFGDMEKTGKHRLVWQKSWVVAAGIVIGLLVFAGVSSSSLKFNVMEGIWKESNKDSLGLGDLLDDFAKRGGHLSSHDKEVLAQWREHNKHQRNYSRLISEVESQNALYIDSRPDLASFSCDVGQDAMTASIRVQNRISQQERALQLDRFVALAHVKIAALVRMKKSGGEKEIQEFCQGMRDQEAEAAALQLWRCDDALSRGDRKGGTAALISYFERFPGTKYPSIAEYMLRNANALLNSLAKAEQQAEFKHLAESELNWALGLSSRFREKFIGVALSDFLDTCNNNYFDASKRFWSSVGEADREELSTNPDFYFAYGNYLLKTEQWPTACLFYLKKGETLRAGPKGVSECLEPYRMAIFCASVPAQKNDRGKMVKIPKKVLSDVESGFREELKRNPSYWVERLLATMYQEKDIGEIDYSIRLLRLCNDDLIESGSAHSRSEVIRARAYYRAKYQARFSSDR